MSPSNRILCVGHVCVDIMNYCTRYPDEDTDVGSASAHEALAGGGNRCLDQIINRGGNASNTATVLAELGCQTEFLGTIPCGSMTNFIIDDFKKSDIHVDSCPIIEASTPLSCVVINCRNGSRTIIHSNRDLPELNIDQFRSALQREYRWIHFEGRNISNVVKMIDEVKAIDKTIHVSVEVEKAGRKDVESLLGLGDVVFISKEFAISLGFENMTLAVKGLKHRTKPSSILICPWGEQGAAACDSQGQVVTSMAYVPETIVDTLGAGDTFIAAAIYSLANKTTLKTALESACRIAGKKVGMKGLKGIKNVL